jgi:hypothetical protein
MHRYWLKPVPMKVWVPWQRKRKRYGEVNIPFKNLDWNSHVRMSTSTSYCKSETPRMGMDIQFQNHLKNPNLQGLFARQIPMIRRDPEFQNHLRNPNIHPSLNHKIPIDQSQNQEFETVCLSSPVCGEKMKSGISSHV